MGNESGTWIMYGVEPDDSERCNHDRFGADYSKNITLIRMLLFCNIRKQQRII